jgi:hypothetical protein
VAAEPSWNMLLVLSLSLSHTHTHSNGENTSRLAYINLLRIGISMLTYIGLCMYSTSIHTWQVSQGTKQHITAYNTGPALQDSVVMWRQAATHTVGTQSCEHVR